MSNPNAAASAQEKTQSYAWIALVVSLLAAISIVYAWMWLPAITFPVFKGWLGANCASVQADPSQFGLLSNVMGLVPIAALIMAFPASFVVRKFGPKVGTLVGLGLAIIGSAVCALTITSSFMAFLVGRFILGLGLAQTMRASFPQSRGMCPKSIGSVTERPCPMWSWAHTAKPAFTRKRAKSS